MTHNKNTHIQQNNTNVPDNNKNDDNKITHNNDNKMTHTHTMITKWQNKCTTKQEAQKMTKSTDKNRYSKTFRVCW